MNDNRFEQMWREALENASENPPLHVWNNISNKIDKDNNFDSIIATKFIDASKVVPSSVWNAIDTTLGKELSFEEEFNAAIGSTSINPPESVWENVRALLDEEDERKPILIFWTNKWIAGGIAAMLIALLSIPLLNNWVEKSPSKEIAQNTISKTEKTENNTGSSEKSEIGNFPEELIGDSNNGKALENSGTKGINKPLFSNANSKQNSFGKKEEIVTLGITNEKSALANLIEKVKKILPIESLDFLQNKSFTPYGSSLTLKRKKLALPMRDDAVAYESNAKSKSWFGFMSGLAPFDPNISITNFERQALVSAGNVPSSFFEYKSVVENTGIRNGTDAFEIPLSQPFNNIRTGSAVNLGIDYGFKMARNFSFQTGARYTRSSSFIQSNVYSYNPNTGNVSTFLESNYFAKENSNKNSTLISSAEDIKNAYQFLMIPIQLGYHVPVFDKIELSASAGVSGDFLINNILDETPEAGSKLTPGNSAYKGFNLSGIGGLKVNYQVNDNWDASIGANYQQALQSGVDASQNFSFRPKFFGVSYGINYKLN